MLPRDCSARDTMADEEHTDVVMGDDDAATTGASKRKPRYTSGASRFFTTFLGVGGPVVVRGADSRQLQGEYKLPTLRARTAS